MTFDERDPGSERPVSHLKLVRLQAEANQELLLTALRANEQVDEAYGAQEEAEKELDALRLGEQELRSTAAFRERLIAIIGHDLRTPLSSILMTCQVLLSRDNLMEEDARSVARLMRTGRRMTRMIDQLADFTRARSGGGFSLTTAPADVGEICGEIAEELRVGSGVALQLTAQGDLRGVWDADRLAQALSNIAGNAVEHAAPGSTVSIDAHEEGDQVAVAITNTGPCIPPSLLPVIFSAFRRAETAVGDRSGHLGLGLFVACEITRAHEGTLRVCSSNGTTTFTMRLPRGPSTV